VEVTALVVALVAGIMTSAITAVDGGTLVVEEFVVNIARTQGKREIVAAHPNHGTIEIYDLGVAIPLPGAEDVTEVGVAAHPEDAIEIRPVVEAKHIIEVDFIDSLVLREAEVELIGHLIREEEGFLASLGEAHGCGRGNYRHHQDQGHH
jgi:restriction endonuclease Mrr